MAENDGSKICPGCQIQKDDSEFSRDSRKKDGLRSTCKACCKKQFDTWHTKNLERQRERYAANYRENADRYKSHARRSREVDPAATKLKDAEKHQKHKERRNATSAKRRVANPELVKAYNKKYVADHLVAYRSYNAKRRSKLTENGGSYTADDVKELFHLQGGMCPVCRGALGEFDVDHVHPLSKGGSNGRENIQLLCQRCNRSKNAKDPIEFMQSRGFLI